jgi:flagellar transcriptional activator FlhD
MQDDSRLLTEIREANLSFLILTQTLVRQDKAQALFRLGISEPVADLLAALTPSQLLKVASSNMLMFRFRFDDAMIWSLLTDHGVRDTAGEESSASRLHASILMSGRYSEAMAA